MTPPSAASGGCFGFVTDTDLPLTYTRGGGSEPLEIAVGASQQPCGGAPLMRWAPPSVPFRADLYPYGAGFRLWVDGTGWFSIYPRRAEIVLPDVALTARLEERLWGIPSLLCFLGRGDHAIHAAAVEVGEGAVLLAAPGRWGKTTLAAAFADAGFRVLAEDLACVRLAGAPEILPGPAMLRLRPDVAAHLRPRGTHVVAETDERVHLALDADRRGTADAVPLRAVVFLRPQDHPEPRLEPADAVSAVPDLWALSFSMPTDADRARAFAGVTALATGVELWNLHRPVTFDGLSETVDAVVEGLSVRA